MAQQGRKETKMSMNEAAMLLGVSPADVENEARELGQPSDRALSGEEVPQ